MNEIKNANDNIRIRLWREMNGEEIVSKSIQN